MRAGTGRYLSGSGGGRITICLPRGFRAGHNTGYQNRRTSMTSSPIQRADLHMHSTASDGRMDPADLAQAAAEGGLDLVSLTDHDTVAGWEAFQESALQAGIRCVPGVEISARQEGEEVHLVGYAFHPGHEGLRTFLALQQQRRNDRAQAFVNRFKQAGLLPESAELESEGQNTSWARPHIARLLIKHGAVKTMDEAFNRYLTVGTPTFVEKPLPSGQEAIAVVHDAGGIVCLAHPGHHVSHQVVMGLIAAGLDGLEVVHPSHDNMLEEYYESLADRKELLKSGGSDFHARPAHDERKLGDRWFTPDAPLLNALRTH